VGPGWAFTDQVTGLVPCVGCPTFTSEAFDVETRFAGVPKLHVTVTPTAPTAEVAASLSIVDGSERLLVGWGAMDIRFAEGGSEPIIVTPGEPLLLKMVLEPLDVVIPAGAALELTLHQRGYGDHTPGLPLAPMTVEAGGEQSTLTIHTFTRGPEVFFEPPG
jgi:predicted acyl esterase